MSKIKVAELFYSLQGEGRYQGVPSIFLRTFGCNFTCSHWGLTALEIAEGRVSEQRDRIAQNVQLYKRYEELPLVSTGCDSYASWDVRFKDLSPVLTSEAIAKRICELLPYNEWRSEHLVITGGEPLLGWQRSYPDLLNHPLMSGLNEITFETNGTQPISEKFGDALAAWTNERRHSSKPDREITFSVSAKLSNSGETYEDRFKPDVVASYQDYGHVYLKFVVATEADAMEAMQLVAGYRALGFEGPVYLMPFGGTTETFAVTHKMVAEMAMQYGYRYSDRLQVSLWRNAWGT